MTNSILRSSRISLSIFLASVMAFSGPSNASAEIIGKLTKGYGIYRGAKAMKKGYDVARKVITLKDRLQLAYQFRRWKDVAAMIRDDVVFATRVRISPKQFRQVVAHLEKNGGLQRRSPQALKDAREAFDRSRSTLMADWSKATSKPWPTSKVTLQSNKGGILAKAGQEHQAHHIIPLELGGANAWWNIVPAEAAGAHQFGLHGTGSVLKFLSAII